MGTLQAYPGPVNGGLRLLAERSDECSCHLRHYRVTVSLQPHLPRFACCFRIRHINRAVRHHSTGYPMSQRECAGFNAPLFSVVGMGMMSNPSQPVALPAPADPVFCEPTRPGSHPRLPSPENP
jgi:hypothetical protein